MPGTAPEDPRRQRRASQPSWHFWAHCHREALGPQLQALFSGVKGQIRTPGILRSVDPQRRRPCGPKGSRFPTGWNGGRSGAVMNLRPAQRRRPKPRAGEARRLNDSPVKGPLCFCSAGAPRQHGRLQDRYGPGSASGRQRL